MGTHEIVGGLLAVKAAIDMVRSLGGLLRWRKDPADLVPVYRLTAKRPPPGD
ncbi:hypothetical protein GCM10011611_61800 [Aliidongia dinghuensis]|uniref:Uncharacterized protein n=1 Tax=Aliidongia dinghuensis TaxID=1867774 RepID=A0A8J3E5F6_9PROT|nr:hypothetical protein [Aliidongia dinghuensis]GGF47022.1 hypothetical protein GCM10011611_61800 [Aliidongia dinghuensis]